MRLGSFGFGLGLGPGLRLGFGLRLSSFGFNSRLGLDFGVVGIGHCDLARSWVQVGDDPDHDVIATRLDAIVGGLPQGQDNARPRTAPFLFTDVCADQSDGIGAGVHGNLDVAQTSCADVNHHPRRLFQLPGREGGPG